MNSFSRQEITALILPVLKAEGTLYRKCKPVLARLAEEGEWVSSISSDGQETRNQAAAGDYLVQNQTGASERYLIKPEKFRERYLFDKPAEDGFDQYRPIGWVVALKLDGARLQSLDLPERFQFIAPWGEPMVCKRDDYIVCPPDYSEIYRIADREFNETYKPDSD